MLTPYGGEGSGQRIVELHSIVTADEVAEQLGEILNLDVKTFAVPVQGGQKRSSNSAPRRAAPDLPKK